MITLRDRSTQTSDVIIADSASSPARPSRRDVYTGTFGSSAPQITSRRESTNLRSDDDDDDDEQTGSELPACSRCGAGLARRDATVGRCRVSRPRDDVIGSRDRRAKALRGRTSPASLRHHLTATAAADEVIMIIVRSQRWRGGTTGRALDLRSTGRGFKSYSGQKLHA